MSATRSLDSVPPSSAPAHGDSSAPARTNSSSAPAHGDGHIDAERWPGVADVPAGPRAAVAGPLAERLFRAAVARLPLLVSYPDGSTIGAGRHGEAPVMYLHRPDAFRARLGHNGLIGLGESYMAGDWSGSDLTGVLAVFAARAGDLVPEPVQRLRNLYLPRQPRRERNSTANTRSNISRHYDLSNDLFAAFLDETMTYSSAQFDAAGPALAAVGWQDLAEAQRRKVDSLLDKAGVGEGSRVLEIGTGWGELAIRAAVRGATVVSVTLSSEQQHLAQKRIAEAGYTGQVTVELKDYRAVSGRFDAVVSVEMIEAVGFEYWPTYFRTIDKVLAPGGRVAIQAITMPHHRMLATRSSYTWVHKYIFPGGIIPSVRAIEEVTEQHTSLRLRERLSLGDHYAQTLRLWNERFTEAAEEVEALGFDKVFQRMWQFYLCYSRAGFESGYLDVQQLSFDRRDAEATA